MAHGTLAVTRLPWSSCVSAINRGITVRRREPGPTSPTSSRSTRTARTKRPPCPTRSGPRFRPTTSGSSPGARRRLPVRGQPVGGTDAPGPESGCPHRLDNSPSGHLRLSGVAAVRFESTTGERDAGTAIRAGHRTVPQRDLAGHTHGHLRRPHAPGDVRRRSTPSRRRSRSRSGPVGARSPTSAGAIEADATSTELTITEPLAAVHIGATAATCRLPAAAHAGRRRGATARRIDVDDCRRGADDAPHDRGAAPSSGSAARPRHSPLDAAAERRRHDSRRRPATRADLPTIARRSSRMRSARRDTARRAAQPARRDCDRHGEVIGFRFFHGLPCPLSSKRISPRLTLARRGKVRDVYDLGEHLLIVATDRISAFDYVLGSGIPDKGTVLTQLSAFWFGTIAGDLTPHHLVS